MEICFTVRKDKIMSAKKISVIAKVFYRKSPLQITCGLLELLWGYPLYLLSFICRRNRKKWLFGNSNGFTDNSKYLYLHTVKRGDVRGYWITRDRNLIRWMREHNLPVFHRYSIRGLYHCLTSYLYIYTTSPNAVNFFTSGGSRLVNLWHGVGCKNHIIPNDTITGNRDLLSKIFMPYVSKRPNYLLEPSPAQKEYFKQWFRVDDNQLLDDIYPRCAFLRQNRSDILKHIRSYEPEQTATLIEEWRRYDRIYLYMPTFRANLSSSFLDMAFPDMSRLNEILQKVNSILVIKQHPLVKQVYSGKPYENIHFLETKYDIYPLLPFTDVLITDYSSIYSDYVLMDGKGVILYPFDLEEYKKNDASLMDWRENCPGIYASTFAELLELIENREVCDIPGKEVVRSMYWGDYKSRSIETLYLKLLNID